MKNLTATQLARNLSDVLDGVEHRGETYVIARQGRPVATLAPAPKRSTGGALLRLLEQYPPDPDWAREIAETRKLLFVEERNWPD